MWKCNHCETKNREEEVRCRVCGFERPKSFTSEDDGSARKSVKHSPLIDTINNCARSNVSIAAVIFYAANILLQLLGVMFMVNSATSIFQNELANEIFGLSDLSEAILSSIVNYSISAILISNLPAIIICVFGMIYCFYARFSKSELKINALIGIRVVEIIKTVLDGLLVLVVLIYAIMFIPNIPSAFQGPTILLTLFVLGYLVLHLIFGIFIINTLMSLINSIKYNNNLVEIPTFVGVMLYIYGCLFGLSALFMLVPSPALALAAGCECTAYILFAISLFKLRQEAMKTPVGAVADSKSEAWKRPVEVGYSSRTTTTVSGSGVIKDTTRSHRYTPTGKATAAPHRSYPAGTTSRSAGSFKKAKDLD